MIAVTLMWECFMPKFVFRLLLFLCLYNCFDASLVDGGALVKADVNLDADADCV